jgi:anti-sigma factor RsiW
MSCRELVELVTDYLDGALPAADAARFEEHIEQCHWCARYLEQMRVTIATVGRIDEESISGEARTTLLAAFSGWSGGERPLREPPG